MESRYGLTHLYIPLLYGVLGLFFVLSGLTIYGVEKISEAYRIVVDISSIGLNYIFFVFMSWGCINRTALDILDRQVHPRRYIIFFIPVLIFYGIGVFFAVQEMSLSDVIFYAMWNICEIGLLLGGILVFIVGTNYIVGRYSNSVIIHYLILWAACIMLYSVPLGLIFVNKDFPLHLPSLFTTEYAVLLLGATMIGTATLCMMARQMQKYNGAVAGCIGGALLGLLWYSGYAKSTLIYEYGALMAMFVIVYFCFPLYFEIPNTTVVIETLQQRFLRSTWRIVMYILIVASVFDFGRMMFKNYKENRHLKSREMHIDDVNDDEMEDVVDSIYAEDR